MARDEREGEPRVSVVEKLPVGEFRYTFNSETGELMCIEGFSEEGGSVGRIWFNGFGKNFGISEFGCARTRESLQEQLEIAYQVGGSRLPVVAGFDRESWIDGLMSKRNLSGMLWFDDYDKQFGFEDGLDVWRNWEKDFGKAQEWEELSHGIHNNEA